MRNRSHAEATILASQLRLLKEDRQDTSTQCGACGSEMRPEHAHYICPACGWRDSCCDGGEQT